MCVRVPLCCPFLPAKHTRNIPRVRKIGLDKHVAVKEINTWLSGGISVTANRNGLSQDPHRGALKRWSEQSIVRERQAWLSSEAEGMKQGDMIGKKNGNILLTSLGKCLVITVV